MSNKVFLKNAAKRILENKIEDMRNVLKLPEETISQVAELDCKNAISRVLNFFIIYNDDGSREPQTDYFSIEKGKYKNIDKYCEDFDMYFHIMPDDDEYTKKIIRDNNATTRKNMREEFDAYCKIYKLIGDYIFRFAQYTPDGWVKIIR